MNFDDVLPAFVAEAAELLREMEDGLLECTRGTPSDETINLIFRSAHTIKGSAGLFGLDAIVSFVHGVETLLDRVRWGRSRSAPQLVQSLLDCKDHIAVLVAAAPDAKNGVDAELLARSAQLLKELNEASGGAASSARLPPRLLPHRQRPRRRPAGRLEDFAAVLAGGAADGNGSACVHPLSHDLRHDFEARRRR